MNVAIYARVSTVDQNCEMQLSELRAYCLSRGWGPAVEYVDTGWSGAKASRPELNRLMLDARTRKVDCILVWKLDRWGRSMSNCLQSIQELGGLGVRWIAVTQNLDTDQSNPMSRFMLAIMAAFGEFEREMIRERVMAGMKAARHRGQRFGRPKLVFDRGRAETLHKAGHSLRAIAVKLQVGRATLQRLFARSKTPTQRPS